MWSINVVQESSFYCITARKLIQLRCFFLQLKRWIQKHVNLVFPLCPEIVLDVAMSACTKDIDDVTLGLYGHCSYDNVRFELIFLKI